MMLVPAALSLLALVPQDPVPPSIPMEPGLTIVQSVAGDAYQGRDYEAVIAIDDVSGRGGGPQDLSLTSAAFVKDRAGERRWLSVRRTVLGADLRSAHAFILGFSTDDPDRLPGTTALGPSQALLKALTQTGHVAVSLRNYAARPQQTGTLELVERATSFPVLVNNARVRLPAVRARGQLASEGRSQPWEFWFLDHPVQPLTLRVAHGAPGARSVGQPVWSRQIVRIDVPPLLLTSDGEEVALEDDGGGPLPDGGGDAVGTAGGIPAGEGDALGNGKGSIRGSGKASGFGTGSGAGVGAANGAGAGGLDRLLGDRCRVQVPGIYFEFDSDLLNPASEPWIRTIGDLLRRHPDWTITIEGHTDSVGSVRYNLDLSTRRAAALARSLSSQHGIAAARLSTRGFGPNRPLESNATTEGRARNRRVELVRPCDRPTR
jgi:outer membrane protein OmpA-like peptidoglycan-associated protein